MRRFVALLMFIFWPALMARATVFVQYMPAGPHFPTTGATCTGSDSFTGSGTLSSCWTQATNSGNGTLARVSGTIQLSTGGSGLYAYPTKTVSSQFTITTVSSSFGGPCILLQTGGSGYCWFIQGNQLFSLLNGGGNSTFGTSCPSVSTGQVAQISQTITAGHPTITCTNITTSAFGSGIDTNLCSGSPCSITGSAGLLMGPSDVYTAFVGT